MNLYNAECTAFRSLNVFALDIDRADFLVRSYLEFNYAEHIEFKLSKAVDPMRLDQQCRKFLMAALARNTEGLAVFMVGRGWLISQRWKHPFPPKSE